MPQRSCFFSLLGLVAIVAACLAACGAAGSASQPGSSLSPTPSAATLAQDVSRLDRLVVRRTDAFPQNHIRFSFPATMTVTDTAQVQRVARALLALPMMPKGVFCPADFGIVYHLTFFAAGHALPSISIRATGCEQVGGLGATRWVARSAGFWRTLGLAMGLAKPGYASFRGSGPTG